MVRPANRIFRAISFGVFCRSAPSTIAIIRSRKLLPGSAVIFRTRLSETIRVPPVTLDLSPPLSRITGALSPVIALSSTEATPRTTSASVGMRSPASTRTSCPLRNKDDAVSFGAVSSSPESNFTTVSALVARRLSARALPRPSANASAKFANSTQTQSQNAICRLTAASSAPRAASRRANRVVIAATMAVTKMTAFSVNWRGSSLVKAVFNAVT